MVCVVRGWVEIYKETVWITQESELIVKEPDDAMVASSFLLD